jgi:hypothetical protein
VCDVGGDDDGDDDDTGGIAALTPWNQGCCAAAVLRCINSVFVVVISCFKLRVYDDDTGGIAALTP